MADGIGQLIAVCLPPNAVRPLVKSLVFIRLNAAGEAATSAAIMQSGCATLRRVASPSGLFMVSRHASECRIQPRIWALIGEFKREAAAALISTFKGCKCVGKNVEL